MFCVKKLVESGLFTSIPSKYVVRRNPDDQCVFSEEENIPIVDFSMLTSSNPDQRSKVIQDIAFACREWGFFMVINHGVPELLREEMLRASMRFFNLTEEEKKEFAGKDLFDPIKCGTSFNVNVDEAFFWRDYLKVYAHPNFVAPHKPEGFSKTMQEFCKRIRELTAELLKAISESLGLEENYINKAMEVESGSQVMLVNLYPPCPQPEVAMGLPPHSDHGLLTILMQNDIGGLQVQHNGNWVPINPLPNSFLVNTGDHMEILTNGKYKSIIHRALVNNKATRVSIGAAHGPPLDAIVSPAPELVDSEKQAPRFRGITYREYLKLQQSNQLDKKSCLERIRIN